jgi:hypothetical protein
MSKKKFHLLILWLLVLALCLAACNSATPPLSEIRWSDSETNTYNISVAKFNTETDLTYSEESYGVTFVSNYELRRHQIAYDEVMPSKAEGTYTTELSTNGDKQTYTTAQNLVCTYSAETILAEYFAKVVDFVDALSAADKAALVVSQSATEIVLKSTTDTSVTFTKNASQRPVESSRKIQGYYIGVLHSEVTMVDVETQYDGTTATVNGTAYTLPSINVIDINQLALYQRGLDQSAAFAATPSVVVYNPVLNQSITVGFTLAREYHVLLNNLTINFAEVNCVAAYTQSANTTSYIAAYFNNPKNTMPVSAGTDYNKFSTVKWQNGYFVYEQAEYTSEELEQLAYIAE